VARGDVVGLVLCGGRSSRMGTDKALLDLGGRALIRYPMRALAGAADEVLLACGSEARYAELGAPLVLDAIEDGGPLAGLVAGLEAAAARGARWVAVLAVDLPGADTAVVDALVRRARERDLDACLLELERGVQPTFAVYHTRCAAPARRALAAGERRLVSFHALPVEGRAARIERVRPVELGADEAVAVNLNTPAELEQLRRSRWGDEDA